MSRFNFCDCPAGFSAEPERHAPDCPGRSGAGKARTPVPSITSFPKAAEELDAVLHWRNKHAIAIKERDALQLLLNDRDEKVDAQTLRADTAEAERDTERKFRESAEGGWREANRVIAMQRSRMDADEQRIAELTSKMSERDRLFFELTNSPHAVAVPLNLWKRIKAFADAAALNPEAGSHE